MDQEGKHDDAEIQRLQGCIDDLISVHALPAIWKGQGSSHIVTTLLEALVRVLRLDFAYARLGDPADDSLLEILRQGGRPAHRPAPEDLRKALGPCLASGRQNARFSMPNPGGEGRVSMQVLPFGPQDQLGSIVAGARRRDFPTRTETLVFHTATNLAVISLEEVRRLNERQRAARELELRVIERTEQLRVSEQTLQKLQSEIAHVTRMTTMGELAASIAHEINQPLGAIVNNSNVGLHLLATAPALAPELRDVLSDIIHDANRASAIIARIRTLVRKSAPEKTSLQLADVVADVLALARRELIERHVVVHTEFSPDLPEVSGDRVQLQQVFLNLVMNGIEAMTNVDEARRVLTIEAQRDELAGQAMVRIGVRDLGNGIPPQDVDRLFEAFYTTKSHGLGMGLRISRSIADAHGGRLWATANAGPGATFHCALPVGLPKPPPTVPGAGGRELRSGSPPALRP